MWADVLSDDEAANITRFCRQYGVTSAVDIRAVIEDIARRERERRIWAQVWRPAKRRAV